MLTMSKVPLMLPNQVVQGEWQAMMRRVREVATLRGASEQVNMFTYSNIVLLKAGSDLQRVEEIVFTNLLFEPSLCYELHDAWEIVGNTRLWWRKSSPWTKSQVHGHWLPEEFKGMWNYRFNNVDADR